MVEIAYRIAVDVTDNTQFATYGLNFHIIGLTFSTHFTDAHHRIENSSFPLQALINGLGMARTFTERICDLPLASSETHHLNSMMTTLCFTPHGMCLEKEVACDYPNPCSIVSDPCFCGNTRVLSPYRRMIVRPRRPPRLLQD